MVSRSIAGSAPGLPLPTRPGHMALWSLGKLLVFVPVGGLVVGMGERSLEVGFLASCGGRGASVLALFIAHDLFKLACWISGEGFQGEAMEKLSGLGKGHGDNARGFVPGVTGGSDEREPWSGVLSSAGPRDHIVQLYQDQHFLNRAVCRFAAAAISNGEGVILVPTRAHWEAFRPRLESEGVDVKAAEQRGQLTIVDADNLLPTFMHVGMPDSPVFMGLAQNVVSQVRGDGRYQKVRWWGEMVNILWERGEVAASMQLEDLFDQLSDRENIAIFCSFPMDNFDGDVHARMLPRLGENHSHLIPVEDYERLERAVSDALRDSVGPDESRVLEEKLLSRYPGAFHMPRSQALLLALRQMLPVVAEDVLQRSRNLYRAAS